MTTRRHYSLAVLGVALLMAVGAMAVLGNNDDDKLPDGSASKGMITKGAQEAVDQGLAYLEANQNNDGSFGTNNQIGNVAITSLAGLAFMAGGHQPGRGKYGKCVTKALNFILEHEDRGRPGYIINRRNHLHGPMYGHGFATLFLAEASGMVHQKETREKLRGTLRRAVKLIVETQN